jgi:hypothetical protein
LTPPQLIFKGNEQEIPRDGGWNIREKKFLFTSEDSISWALIAPTEKKDDCSRFWNGIYDAATKKELKLAQKPYILYVGQHVRTYNFINLK